MKAIMYDRQKQRQEVEIDIATDTYVHIMTDLNNAYSVTFKLSFYDKKMRPVYTEQSRQEVDVNTKEAN